ncbi:sulfotransferase [Cognatishimia sp. SS12]|nr:sulfotransferase [Cognatishimia sp. SS12]
MTRAKQATKAEDWVEAHANYQAVLARFPGNKRARQGLEALRLPALPALLKKAKEGQAASNWSLVEQQLATAHALAPDLSQIGVAYASALIENSKPIKALSITDEVLARFPQETAAMMSKSLCLHELDRPAEASAILTELDALMPDAAPVLNLLGLVARSQGRKDEAAAYFRRAIALQPNNAAFHRHLSLVLDYKNTPENAAHIREMKAALAANGAGSADAAPLHFSLFRALDSLGDHDSAFAHLAQGNKLVKDSKGYDFKSDAVVAAVSKTLFAAPLPAPDMAEVRQAKRRQIFVLGLPRTGTTLVERTLSRAAGTQACGELMIVHHAVTALLHEVSSRKNSVITQADFDALRQELLTGFDAISNGNPVMIDKMPLNFRWLGYICTALPEAQIVHINRDPMAVAWSLYKHLFSRDGNRFIYDIADIARFMVLHRDLMDHWRKVCPGRIHDVNYADLVADQRSTTEALATATGLEWTEDWLSPEKATNHVRTASVIQVQKPVYSGSDQAWRAYESHLGPLRDALTQAGIL